MNGLLGEEGEGPRTGAAGGEGDIRTRAPPVGDAALRGIPSRWQRDQGISRWHGRRDRRRRAPELVDENLALLRAARP